LKRVSTKRGSVVESSFVGVVRDATSSSSSSSNAASSSSGGGGMDGPTSDEDLVSMILLATGRMSATLEEEAGSAKAADKGVAVRQGRRNTEGAMLSSSSNSGEAAAGSPSTTVGVLLGGPDGVSQKEFVKTVRRLRIIKEGDRKTIQERLKTAPLLEEKRQLFFGANHQQDKAEAVAMPAGARTAVRRTASVI
jgi:hypothetical protein